MKIVLGNSREYNVLSIQLNYSATGGETRVPLLVILFDQAAVSYANVVEDAKAGEFDKITAINAAGVEKVYDGYKYALNISERLTDFENSLMVNLSTVAPDNTVR